MKFLFVCLLASSFIACGGDDDDANSSDLIGTWKVQSFSFDVEATTVANGSTTVVKTSGAGVDMDYTLEFTGSNFTTAGGYSYDITSEVNGMVNSSSAESVSNVSGSGSYSTSGDVMTIDGSFFEFTFNGADLSALQGEQMTNYEIKSDGTLVFSQDEESSTTTQGVTSTSRIISTSTWERQ